MKMLTVINIEYTWLLMVITIWKSITEMWEEELSNFHLYCLNFLVPLLSAY